MSFLAEFTIRSPLLSVFSDVDPDVRLQFEELHLGGAPGSKLVFWLQSEHFEAVEAALAADDTVAEFALLASEGGRRLYRVTLTDAGREALTYPAAAERDMVFLDVSATADRVRVRARVPDREALKAYRDDCRRRGIEFTLVRLYTEDTEASIEPTVTSTQFEALRTAYEHGFWDEPRQITLAELGDRLGISSTAAGGRIRRGTKHLVEHLVETRR